MKTILKHFKNNVYRIICLSSILLSAHTSQSQIVTTLAGSTAGFADGTRESAQFYSPYAIATDVQGNVYVADYYNSKIRKITPSGVVTTFAGSTRGYSNGQGTSAQFAYPKGIALDKNGNVYVSDTYNNKIRKITPEGIVSTLAGQESNSPGPPPSGNLDGAGANATFNEPRGLAIDASGNLYVADVLNNKIRKITSNGTVSTYAGSTQGDSGGDKVTAQFTNPYGVAIDKNGIIYVADTYNSKIKKIGLDGVVSTLAGSITGFADGSGESAQFGSPLDLKTDANLNVYVADASNHKIRKITPQGVVSTLAGQTMGYLDGKISIAQFNYPTGISIDASGNMFISDSENQKIRKITLAIGNGINEKALSQTVISTYPNPAIDFLNIESTQQIEYVEILSVTGEIVKKVIVSNRVSIDEFPSGMYLLKVQLQNGVNVVKFNKE